MAQGRIEAHKVTTPIQLLAAWFVALIALDGSFLTAAAVIKSPEWAATALLLAAIVNVPLFLGAAFLLQTKYRPELQGDRFYSDYLKDKRTVDNLSGRVRQAVEETGLTLTDLAHGRSLGEEAQQQMKPIVDELKDALKSLEPRLLPAGGADPSSLYALAQGYLTVGNWLAAGRALEEYAGSRPEDFEANFSRGVAYANSRNGHQTDLASLRAYSDAITFVPTGLDNNNRARLLTYRGAMLKRLNRLDEAEADLLFAESLASAPYEVSDIKYNLAGVYALRRDRNKMMEVVAQLRSRPNQLAGIRAHLDDYFANYAHDPEFLALIGAI